MTARATLPLANIRVGSERADVRRGRGGAPLKSQDNCEDAQDDDTAVAHRRWDIPTFLRTAP